MTRGIVVIAVVLSSLLLTSKSFAQMSHDEQAVRNAYAKLSFMGSVEAATQAALAQQRHDSGQPSLDQRLAKSAPIFTLTDFQAGSIASIADRPWKDFVTEPPNSAQVMSVATAAYSSTDSGVGVNWDAVRIQWEPVHQHTPEVDAYFTRPVAEVLQMAAPYRSDKDVTYTRYLSYTVNATLDGASTGQHKAIALFGSDAKGKEAVTVSDLFMPNAGLYHILITPSYPFGLLQTDMREIPAVATWVRSNEISASSCTSAHDLCCANGRCGLSQDDVNRDLAAPVKTGGQR